MKTIQVDSPQDIPKDFTGIAEYLSGVVKEWYKNGELHREDGPAHISIKGRGNTIKEMWFLNGSLHREDGAASITWGGTKEYLLNGIEVHPMEIFDNLSDEEKEEVIWNLDEWK